MAVRTLSVKEIFIVSGGADSSEPTILARVTVTGTKGPILDPYNLQSTLDYFSIYDNYEQDQGGGETEGSVDLTSDWYDASGLGSDVDAIINQSAQLEGLLRYLQGLNPDLIKITTGDSKFSPSTGQIELNVTGLNAAQIVGLLAHEVGHAITENQLYNFPLDSKENYVAHGINVEAQAILFSAQVAYELEGSGTTITIPGKNNNGQQYLDAYKNNINDLDAAIEQIENLMVSLEEVTGSGVSYTQFYGDYYDSIIMNSVIDEPEYMENEDGRYRR